MKAFRVDEWAVYHAVLAFLSAPRYVVCFKPSMNAFSSGCR
jgi:hypothetical protein